jgi:periplasmic mercuric ion binding protein
MKQLALILNVLVILFAFTGIAKSENKVDISTVTLQTSAQCEQCKDRIEKNLKKFDGIKDAVLNLDDKKVTVKYDKNVISVDKIKKILSKTGYDADDVKADAKAYKKLPKCCQKNGHK